MSGRWNTVQIDKYESFNSGLRNWLNNCQMGETLLDKSSCENKFPWIWHYPQCESKSYGGNTNKKAILK